MDEDFGKRIYKYGEEYYSFKEMCEIYELIPLNNKKKFKDYVSHMILAQILRKCGLDKYADSIESIGELERKNFENKLSKLEKLMFNKKYILKIMKLYGLNSIVNNFKVNEFINGEWLLNRLIFLTIGSSCKVNNYGEFSLIDYSCLTIDACKAIADNFKRNMKDAEIIYYNFVKVIKK